MSKKIALLGEAWGKDEAVLGLPFVGMSGQELGRMLEDVGLKKSECLLLNVLNLRPGQWWAKHHNTVPPKDSNDLKYVTLPLKEAKALAPGYALPPISTGSYLHPLLLPELDRLRGALDQFKQQGGNIIVALGATALWACTGSGGITKNRGTIMAASLQGNLKMLATYHPAAVLRAWDLRPIVLADLAKAARESQSPNITRTRRTIFIEPTFEELLWFEREHIAGASALSIDIETGWGQTTCIGFATSPQVSLVVPFFHGPSSYWSPEEEPKVWRWVQRQLARPIRKIGQNFMYDLQRLLRDGFRPWLKEMDDTMLLHHSLYQELDKNLGFLGATYCNESSWKQLRPRGEKTEKKDE